MFSPSTFNTHANDLDSLLERVKESCPPSRAEPEAPGTPTAAHATQRMAQGINDLCLLVMLTAAEVLWSILTQVNVAFRAFRKSIASLLVLYFFFLLSLRLFSTLDTRVLAPLCSTPIISDMVNLCDARRALQATPDYSQLVDIQSGFVDTIEQNLAEDTSLAFGARKAQVAVQALAAQVRVSDLIAKDDLVEKLEDFVAGAYEVTDGLHNMSALVTGAIDQILSMDNFALKHLERIERQGTPSTGISGIIMLWSLKDTKHQQREALAAQFERASKCTAAQLEQTITYAQIVLNMLRRLDSVLGSLGSVIIEETQIVKRDGAELMAQVWTYLGQNGRKVAAFEENRELLSAMTRFCETAVGQVSDTLIGLGHIKANLSLLQRRVAAPETIGADAAIPLEAHLESLRRGVERLGSAKKNRLESGKRQTRNAMVQPVAYELRITDWSEFDRI